MTYLEELNNQIKELNDKRQAFLNDQNKALEEKFLKLKWLNDATLTFCEGLGAYGHTEYRLRGGIPDEFKPLFLSQMTIKLLGDSSNYMENIMIRRSSYDFDSHYEIYTCNAELFVKFARMVHKVNLFNFKDRFHVYKELNQTFGS